MKKQKYSIFDDTESAYGKSMNLYGMGLICDVNDESLDKELNTYIKDNNNNFSGVEDALKDKVVMQNAFFTDVVTNTMHVSNKMVLQYILSKINENYVKALQKEYLKRVQKKVRDITKVKPMLKHAGNSRFCGNNKDRDIDSKILIDYIAGRLNLLNGLEFLCAIYAIGCNINDINRICNTSLNMDDIKGVYGGRLSEVREYNCVTDYMKLLKSRTRGKGLEVDTDVRDYLFGITSKNPELKINNKDLLNIRAIADDKVEIIGNDFYNIEPSEIMDIVNKNANKAFKLNLAEYGEMEQGKVLLNLDKSYRTARRKTVESMLYYVRAANIYTYIAADVNLGMYRNYMDEVKLYKDKNSKLQRDVARKVAKLEQSRNDVLQLRKSKDELKKQIKRVKKEVRTDEDVDKLRVEIEKLKKEKSILEVALNKDNRELAKIKVENETLNAENNELKNTCLCYEDEIKSLSVSDTNIESVDELLPKIYKLVNNRRIFILGGTDSWREKISSKFKSSITRSTEAMNITDIQSNDLVILSIRQMAHCVSIPVLNRCRMLGVKCVIIKESNTQLIFNRLYNELLSESGISSNCYYNNSDMYIQE